MDSTSSPDHSKLPKIIFNPTPLRYALPGTEPLIRTVMNQSKLSSASSMHPAPEPSTTPSQVPANKEATTVADDDGAQMPVFSKRGRKSKRGDSSTISSVDKQPNWLPEGWTTVEAVRETGKSAGTKDKYYYEPVTGKRFRSKREVLRYLEIVVDTPLRTPHKKGELTSNGKDRTIGETPPNEGETKEPKLPVEKELG